MTLRELEAHFVRVRHENVDPNAWVDGVMHPSGVATYIDRVEFAEAHGIWFNCPCAACHAPGAYPRMVVIGFEDRNCPAGELSIGSNGQDTRWKIVGGSGLDDLQLTPSIQHGDHWHGFVGSNGVPPGCAT